MKILGAFMVPHPPLIVEEIGGDAIESIKKTRDSYIEIAKQIAALKPDTIIVSSPHAPLYSDYFYLPNEEKAIGSFKEFDAPKVKFDLEYDVELIKEIESISMDNDFPCGRIPNDEPLDHGTMVPLYFVNKYLSDYKLVVVGLSGLPIEANYEMGRIIEEAVNNLGRRVVYIASGDLSHKLQEYGPYGYVKEGPMYDKKIIDIMSNARFDELLKMDETFLDKASECGHKSFAMMGGFLSNIYVLPEFYSYEDVTGVGYGICSYYPLDPYIELAKATIYNYVKNKKVISVPKSLPEEMLNNKAGVFVSIHEFGELRGCIGTIYPTTSSIAEEIIENAISASSEDPRFYPITEEELDDLVINVDVLLEPEDIDSEKELDPKKYGVIVTSGNKRGLLLPDLEDVNTVEEQISIAKQKAGIEDKEKVKLQRFEVVRHEY